MRGLNPDLLCVILIRDTIFDSELSEMSEFVPVIALHGGAGTILKSNMTPEKEAAYHAGLRECLQAGLDILRKGGKAIDAVTASVIALEENTLFNAGRGAVFTTDETHEWMPPSWMAQLGHAAQFLEFADHAILCWRHVRLWSRPSTYFSRAKGQSGFAKLPVWK